MANVEGPATVTFYVSPAGNDSWSGVLADPNATGTDGPFVTPHRARDAVRELRQHGDASGSAVRVLFRGGRHYLERPLVLGPEDSGTASLPVVYAACPDEAPVLSGGRVIADWRPYRDGILQADLPMARGRRWWFRQLFCDGRRLARASWPKPEPGNPLGGWMCVEADASEGDRDAFVFRTGDLPRRWAHPRQAEVHIYVGHNWLNETVAVESIDWDRRLIRLARPLFQLDRAPWFVHVPIGPPQRFRIENVLEELDRPGEWCLDGEAGRVYLRPLEPTASATIVAPALHCLVDLRRAQHVILSGLTFTETMDGDDYHREGHEGYGDGTFPRRGLSYGGEAVHLSAASHCVVEHCRFDSVGASAIYLEGACSRNHLRRNTIVAAGSYGVAMVGTREAHPMDNRVEDNDISRCGELNKYANAVFLGLSNMNVVAHNSIHDLPHVAIGLGGSGFGRNLIEYNEIRRVDLEISDSGAINAWMEDPYPGIRADVERSGHLIRHNLIADVPGVRVEADGRLTRPAHDRSSLTMAIYLDTCSSNCLVTGNVILRAGRYGVYLQGGRNNVVENNLIVDCGCAAAFSDLVAHWFAPHMAHYMAGNRFVRNVFVSDRADACLYQLINWNERHTAQCEENIFCVPASQPVLLLDQAEMTWEQWQERGFDCSSQITDPGLRRTATGAELAADTPAAALGFVPIDLTRIGIRP